MSTPRVPTPPPMPEGKKANKEETPSIGPKPSQAITPDKLNEAKDKLKKTESAAPAKEAPKEAEKKQDSKKETAPKPAKPSPGASQRQRQSDSEEKNEDIARRKAIKNIIELIRKILAAIFGKLAEKLVTKTNTTKATSGPTAPASSSQAGQKQQQQKEQQKSPVPAAEKMKKGGPIQAIKNAFDKLRGPSASGDKGKSFAEKLADARKAKINKQSPGQKPKPPTTPKLGGSSSS